MLISPYFKASKTSIMQHNVVLIDNIGDKMNKVSLNDLMFNHMIKQEKSKKTIKNLDETTDSFILNVNKVVKMQMNRR